MIARIGETVTSYVERFPAYDYVRTWHILRDACQPVVPDVYRTDRESILVTDVKADGTEAYGQGLQMCLMTDFPGVAHARRRPDRDGAFLDLTSPPKFPAIKDQVMAYVEAATQNYTRLPNDAYEYLVHPDDSGDIGTLDITGAAQYTASPEHTRHLNRVNREQAEWFLGGLVHLRELLSA